MARALEAEARHRSEVGEAASPLAGVGYDGRRREFDLWRFSESPVDDQVRGFVRSAASADGARSRLTMDDFYTLMWFANRSALMTLRTGDVSFAADGLAALVLVDGERVDVRDLIRAAGLVSYALGAVGVDAAKEFAAVTPSTVGSGRKVLERFARSPVGDLHECLYEPVDTPGGLVLLDRSIARYRPTVPLAQIALRLVEVIEHDAYTVSGIMLARDLPAVWTRSGDQEAVARARSQLPAVLSIGAALTPGVARSLPSGPFMSPQLTTFLTEAASPEDAAVLATASKPVPTSTHQVLALTHRSVCSVTIARSVVQGSPPYETAGGLERFRPAFSIELAHGLDES